MHRDNAMTRCKSLAVLWLLFAMTMSADPAVPQTPSPARETTGQFLVTALWKVAEPGRGTPSTDGNVVFFLTAGHDVVALNAKTGTLLWRAATAERGDGLTGSFIGRAGQQVVVGEFDLTLLDVRTGRELWRFAPTNGYGAGLYVGAMAGEMLYTGSPAGRLYAINTATRTERWSYSVSATAAPVTVYEPAIDRGAVYATFTRFTSPPRGGLFALDAATGRLLWQAEFPTLDGVPAMPSGAGSNAVARAGLVVASSETGWIYAFNAATGALRWRAPPVGKSDRPPASPAVEHADLRGLAIAGDQAFAGSLTGTVSAYQLSTGTQRWTADPNLGSTDSRIGSDGRLVYVPYGSGTLLGFDVSTGAVRLRLGDADDRVTSLPFVVANRLYVSSSRHLSSLAIGMSGRAR